MEAHEIDEETRLWAKANNAAKAEWALEPAETDYDTVRVYFNDDTSTVINVLVDDDIADAIVTMCEDEGFDLLTVTNFTIEGGMRAIHRQNLE